ncbi:NAD-dependent epimerase/dehydratase family protein [Streptomyces sp. NPDC003327]
MAPRVLVTGATGFIGSRVLAATAGHPGIGHVRLLTRRPLDPPAAGAAGGPVYETVPGDLRDPAALRRACAGADVLLHCASAIGGDEDHLRTVNDRGTRALVEAAVDAGVSRIVALSTASVHGRGPFRAAAPGTLPLAPGSATSRTRAAADGHVLDAGGTVLRPHLVYGTGDRQLVPGIVRLLGALPGPLTGTSLHSMTDVDRLAEVLLGAALSPATRPGPYYVDHPEPVPADDLVAAGEALLARLPGRAGRPRGAALGFDEAGALLAGDPVALHHLAMVATDHWFADARPWRELGCDPGPAFGEAFARHARWYRTALAGG